MRKQILVLLLSPQLFIVHSTLSRSAAEALSDVNEALDAAVKDFNKINSAEQIARAAINDFPTDGYIANAGRQLQFLKQIGDLPDAKKMEGRQPPTLINALPILFGIWKTTTEDDIRKLAYERIKAALDNIKANAKSWDQKDLNDLEVITRAMRADDRYDIPDPNTNLVMSYVFRRAVDDALAAIIQGLGTFPTPAVFATEPMQYVPSTPSAPPVTPTTPLYPTIEPPAPAVPYRPTVTPATPTVPSTPPVIKPQYIYKPMPSTTPSVTPVTPSVTPMVTPSAPRAQLTQEQMHSELRRLKLRVDWLRNNMPA